MKNYTKQVLNLDEDYAMVLHIHDEMQFIVKKNRIEQFKDNS